MKRDQQILLAFYGDDFTGSTDALEFISKAGAKAVLFTEVPTADQIRSFEGLDAFGVAGMTRSMSPSGMQDVLMNAFRNLKELVPKHVHYKVCSTFDSSPSVGSIGKAIDCGAEVFQNDFVPVLGGMPSLGRYCLFGNLFARMGIGSNGKIYRLDRHPSMSKHPVTPSDESDLRLHLGRQTKKKFALIDALQFEKPIQQWESLVTDDDEAVLIDVLDDQQLPIIGEWIDQRASNSTLFSVGSSGIEKALGDYWNKRGVLSPVTEWKDPGQALPILVISGSCSPVTQRQITKAVSEGFIEVFLEREELKGEHGEGQFIGCDISSVIASLKDGKNVIIHSGNIKDMPEPLAPEIVGGVLGQIVKKVCGQIKLKRVIVAGGDTSSYAARAMGIEAVEMIAPIVPGAPLCKAHAPGSSVDGIEINFKGGQVGDEDYFRLIASGRLK